MTEDSVTRALALLELSAQEPDPDFAERLRLRFLAEADGTTVAPAPQAPPRAALRLPAMGAWRPAIAVAVLALLVVTVVVVVPSGRSPVSALETARERFLDLPSYRATTRVAANDSHDDPDFEQVWETEDVFRDRTHWRSTVRSTSGVGSMGVGDFRVFDGDLLGEFRAAAGLFVVTPADDLDTAVGLDPSFFFDPSLQWWGTGRPGDPGKPSDAFFAENCEATADTHLGRDVTVLTCDADPTDIELVLDDQTGMLLRIEVFDTVREITAIEFTDELDDDLFDVAPPDGARVHWAGSGAPPPEFAVEPDGEVSAGWDVISSIAPPDAELAGLTIDAVGSGTVWLSAIWCSEVAGCHHQLLAFDDVTGDVTVIDPPIPSFVNGLGVADDLVWVALAEQPSDRLVIREIDRSAGTLSEPVHDLGPAYGGAVAVGDWVWAVGGTTRVVEIGPAQSTYAGLVGVDLSTGARLTVTLEDAGFTSTPVVADDTLWVITEAIDPADPYESLGTVVAVDPGTGEILTEIALPFVPAARPTVMDSSLYLVHYEDGWMLSRLDLEDRGLTTVRVAAAGTELGQPVTAGGQVWVPDFLGDHILRIDPSSLEVVDTVTTGRGPSGLAQGDAGLWVANQLDGTLVRINLP